VDLPVVANPMYAHYTSEAIPSWGDRQKLESALQSRLRALVPTDPAYADVHTQVRVLSQATPAEAIVEHAAAIGADLIIIGHRGWSTLANLLVGSTAERVLKHAPCPVMIVRAKG
jgi:nucleotide-binding universal stress UspA family protein